MAKLELLAKIVAESLGASYGSALLAYLVSFVLILLLGDSLLMQHLLIAPTFLLPIAAGTFLACCFRKRLSSRSILAWIAPLTIFLIGSREVLNAHTTRADAWADLVGTNCQASECLYEGFLTLPVVSGVAYSVVSFILIRLVQMRARNIAVKD